MQCEDTIGVEILGWGLDFDPRNFLKLSWRGENNCWRKYFFYSGTEKLNIPNLETHFFKQFSSGNPRGLVLFVMAALKSTFCSACWACLLWGLNPVSSNANQFAGAVPFVQGAHQRHKRIAKHILFRSGRKFMFKLRKQCEIEQVLKQLKRAHKDWDRFDFQQKSRVLPIESIFSRSWSKHNRTVRFFVSRHICSSASLFSTLEGIALRFLVYVLSHMESLAFQSEGTFDRDIYYRSELRRKRIKISNHYQFLLAKLSVSLQLGVAFDNIIVVNGGMMLPKFLHVGQDSYMLLGNSLLLKVEVIMMGILIGELISHCEQKGWSDHHGITHPF